MDWNRYHLRTRTTEGTWSIRKRGAKYHPFFEDEDLGRYSSPASALDELIGGYSDWPSCGDPAECALPEDPEDWDVVPNHPR